MLTQSQQNAIFTNIGTSYTVDGTVYTAIKIYRDHWSGIVLAPTILLNYISRTRLEQDSIGKRAEYDSDYLTVEVLATTDTTNSNHGLEISETITRELIMWFKESFDNDLKDYGVTATIVNQVKDLSFLEEKIYRLHFEVKIFYKLI